MLSMVLIALAVIVIALVVVVALQPSEFRVARSTTISAPPPVVFAQVNDFHKWEAWNPWGKIDPAMKHAYEGAPAGTGAVATHVRLGSPLFSHILFPVYVAVLLWGGLYLRDERLRVLIPFRRVSKDIENPSLPFERATLEC